MNCSDLLDTRVGKYVSDVVSSAGLRLALKPAPKDEKPYYGFLAPANPQAGLAAWAITELPVRLAGVRGQRLALLSGLYHQLIRRPVSELTNMTGLGRLEPTAPLLLLLSVFAWQGVDAASEVIYNSEVAGQVDAHLSEYQNMLQSDFRFHKIKEDLEQGQMSTQDAWLRVYWLKMAMDKYYHDRKAQSRLEPTLARELNYLNFFTHLKAVIEVGVDEAPGYLVPETSKGLLSDAQILALIGANHRLFLNYQLIVEMIKDSSAFHQLQSDKSSAALVQQFTGDPFTAQIMLLMRQGRISTVQAQRTLQEDAYWQARFAEWEIIKVKRLKVHADGTSGPDLLSLQDLRAELLASLSGPLAKAGT